MKKLLRLIIIIIILWLWYLFITKNHTTKAPADVTACTMDYTPVCAKTYLSWTIPILKTFGNTCMMDAAQKTSEVLVAFLYNGECIKDEPQKSWANYIITVSTSDKYIVKTEESPEFAGQNIYVYDLSGNLLYDLPSTGDTSFQRYAGTVGDNIIAQYSTSPDWSCSIYDIPNKQKIFSDTYHTVYTWVAIAWTTVSYNHAVRINGNDIAKKPADAPTCTGIDDGYMRTMTYDLTTKTIVNTWSLTCTYFE